MKLLQRSTWAACALLAGLAASPAKADRVHWTVQVGLPLPVITVPVPRIEPVPVVVSPGWRDRDRDGIPDWRDRHDDRHGHRLGWRVDRDRDGVPDWRDPYDNRRDWHDRHHHRRGWHDRGGWHDHRDDPRPPWRDR